VARQIDLPRAKQLKEEQRVVDAVLLAREIRKVLPDDPVLEDLWQDLTVEASFRIEPEGTQVYYRHARDVSGPWILAGQSPLIGVRLPNCDLRFRYVKAGYVTKEFQRPFPAFLEWTPTDALRAEQGEPQEMVFIDGAEANKWNQLPSNISPFLIDRYEVSNREYQEFVDAGGYDQPEYWQDVPFIRDGGELSWEKAMAFFVDATGHAQGPAGWLAGKFPPGESDYPVTGICWYEALAFARFAGKALPTVHHWKWAASSEDVGITASLSNFSDRGLTPRGTHTGIGRFEVYDVAGNAKEWCWNENEDGLRCLRGGAWSESEYRYTLDDYASPWDRGALHGFRCVRYLTDDAPEELTLQPVPKYVRAHRDVARKPLEFLRNWYDFDRLPLNAQQVQFDDPDPHPDYRHEVVHVDAAYVKERLEIHLFVPRGKQQKYDTVIWVPGIDRWNSKGTFTAKSYHDMKYVVDLPKSGRIVCHPIYMGTFQRYAGRPFYEHHRASPVQARDDFIAVSKDVSRAVDYLLTRADVNADRLIYFGHSLGAFRGPATLVTDGRFTAAVLLSGGYTDQTSSFPEIDNYQFTPHLKTPVLMINGATDTIGAYETSQLPCYEDIGSEIKKHVVLPAGHNPPAQDVFSEMTKWLDQLFADASVEANRMQ
jgi:predicted esterase